MASKTGVVGGIAERYASALYDLADEAKALDAVASDLKDLQGLLAKSAQLMRLVRSPLIGRSDKARAIAEIMGRAGMGDLTRRFVGVVAGNGRLFALPRMIEVFLAELARRRGEVRADVVTARPLTDEQAGVLKERLDALTGGHVSLDAHVDPAIIGGLVVQIGSRMYDSSIRSKLLRLQLVMKGAQ